MKTTIPHSQTTPTNDLLNLPDIDGVFNEVKGQSAPEPSQTTLKAAPTDIRQTNGSWQLFQQYAQQYGYRVKKYDRKNYEIDNEVVDLLKLCNINNMSVTDIINAALRAFIGTNGSYLKEFLRRNDCIINNLQDHV
ncbi:lipase [Segatella salivae]|uniref:lipase n=1 Tax=Segatella salivae TaxID=228604 RepID=UPI00311A8FCF